MTGTHESCTLLTADQVAARLHRSRRTVQRWARERRVPHVKIGRATLFTEAQVAEILAAYTRAPVEHVPDATLPNPRYLPRGPVVVPMRKD